MLDNKVILKTTDKNEVVRSTEILNVSVDFVNKSVNFNEREVIVDFAGQEIKLAPRYSHLGLALPAKDGHVPAAGELQAADNMDQARNEKLANDIIALVKAYRLEKFAKENAE